MNQPILQIRDLRLSFMHDTGWVEVLHGISLHVRRGERVAVVGESGSGKSVTARIVLGLLQKERHARVSGLVEFEGRDLGTLPGRDLRAMRGTRMSMIFQDPVSSLNPVFTIETQFREVLRRGDLGIDRRTARARAVIALADAAISSPERVLASYPFQLSGGMNQRVMIAMALSNAPSLLIADEPGTALDATVQEQTLALMRDLVMQRNTAVLFISHNLGVVREFADRVYVIYRGRIVEQGSAQQLMEAPLHPYTQALLSAVPRITGGGIPKIEDASVEFLAPPVVHEGFAEPLGAP